MANEEITTGIGWAVVTDVDPTALDSSYPRWFQWCNKTNNKMFVIVDNTPDNAIWKEIAFV